jgi:hypothetical protein
VGAWISSLKGCRLRAPRHENNDFRGEENHRSEVIHSELMKIKNRGELEMAISMSSE